MSNVISMYKSVKVVTDQHIKRKDPFIASIPIKWLAPICKTTKHHLWSIALCTWHLYCLNKKTTFSFSYKKALNIFGISKAKAWRGIHQLEKLGLIKRVEIKHGASPKIQVINVHNNP